ncbi:MAG: hypothetical protein PVG03_05645 [Desulfarculaceae bacterium]
MCLTALSRPRRSPASRLLWLTGLGMLAFCLLWATTIPQARAASLSVNRTQWDSVAVNAQGIGIPAIDLSLSGGEQQFAYYAAASGLGYYARQSGGSWTMHALNQLQGNLDPNLPVTAKCHTGDDGQTSVTFVGVSPDQSQAVDCTFTASLGASNSFSVQGQSPFNFSLAAFAALGPDAWIAMALVLMCFGVKHMALALNGDLFTGAFGGGAWAMTLLWAGVAAAALVSLCLTNGVTPNIFFVGGSGVMLATMMASGAWAMQTVLGGIAPDQVFALSSASWGPALACCVLMGATLMVLTQGTYGLGTRQGSESWQNQTLAENVDGKQAVAFDSWGRLHVVFRDAGSGDLVLALQDNGQWQRHQIDQVESLNLADMEIASDGTVHILTVQRAGGNDALVQYQVNVGR